MVGWGSRIIRDVPGFDRIDVFASGSSSPWAECNCVVVRNDGSSSLNLGARAISGT